MKKVIVVVILALMALAGWSIWDSLQDKVFHEESAAGGAAQGEPAAEGWEAVHGDQARQGVDLDRIPEYEGEPAVEVNGGEPEFSDAEIAYAKSGGSGAAGDGSSGGAASGDIFVQEFSPLDSKGRCGPAFACLDEEHMPEGERGSIGMIKPSGWQTAKYDFIDNGGYLYNRCHMIGWQLTGENANRRNLITGTRYLNVEGMLPFEDEVADYVRSTGNHVLYRVTPVFEGDELVARGVLMEALSMEDGGDGVRFCVFCYNVQPGVTIDYATGISRLTGDAPQGRVYTAVAAVTFIVNVNTGKYHLPDCAYAASISEKNREEMTATPMQMADLCYSPCSRCHPDLEVKTASFLYGDIDADGQITPADARLVLRFTVELEVFTGLQAILADVDGSPGINPADARKVLRASVGLEVI